MATRSRNSESTLPHSSPDAASTPRNHRTQSPTRLGHSRISEKLELQSLNDRLAGYIDRVRFLESENSRLTVEVKTVRETVTRESSNIKSVNSYNTESQKCILNAKFIFEQCFTEIACLCVL